MGLPVQRSCYWRKIINYISEKPVGDVGEGEVVIGNQMSFLKKLKMSLSYA